MNYISKRAAELNLPIEDATEGVFLEVEPGDVERATSKNSRCCAFVRACERQLPIKAAFFLRSTAFLEYDDKILRFVLPESVQKEIVSFDRSRIVEPGLYSLRPPAPSREAPARRKAEKRKGHHEETGLGRPWARARVTHRTSGIRTGSDPSYRAGK